MNQEDKLIPNALVSIVIITYNSSQYIIETLESAKFQTYLFKELIVSDDCSSDNTVEICGNWIEENKSYFTNTKLITNSINTGITGNCYRGYINASGEWVKILAGDDVLENDCITKYIDYVSKNLNIRVVQSNSKYYKNDFSETNYIKTRRIADEILMKNPLSLGLQRKILIYSPSVNAPTLFVKKEFIESIGFMDNRIPKMDDWPLWIKISNSKTIIYGLDEVTVKYRVNSNSISNNGSIVNGNYIELFKYQKEYLWSELTVLDKFFISYEYLLKKIFSMINTLKFAKFIKLLFYFLMTPVFAFILTRNKYYVIKYNWPLLK